MLTYNVKAVIQMDSVFQEHITYDVFQHEALLLLKKFIFDGQHFAVASPQCHSPRDTVLSEHRTFVTVIKSPCFPSTTTPPI